MKPWPDLMRLIGGTAFWVIVAILVAGYLAPLGQYLDDDRTELAFDDTNLADCPPSRSR